MLKWQLQAPDAIVMVRPRAFGFNPETSASNAFQQKGTEGPSIDISATAKKEFDAFVELIRSHGIEVFDFDEIENANTPDAVFPNNWISTHNDGTVVLYPMMAPNRRRERRRDILETLTVSHGFAVSRLVDLTTYEMEGRYLEGTGSIIFDHINHIAYANRSPRTEEKMFYYLCERLTYKPVLFTATDNTGKDIYHTNVLMTLGDKYAVICLESIAEDEVDKVVGWLEKTGHEIVDISRSQMSNFAGNMIQLRNDKDEKFLVMSQSAKKCLNETQLKVLEKYNTIIAGNIPTIERFGGGSARCMISGVHLPRSKNAN
ncbi:MAG: citrulline utilization hydrolase CtlX [Cyclobacteriaceae bacterium]